MDFQYDFRNATGFGTKGTVTAKDHMGAAKKIVAGSYSPREWEQFKSFHSFKDSGTRSEGYHYINHYYKGELSKQIRVKQVA